MVYKDSKFKSANRRSGSKADSASTESPAELRAGRKADRQMGRRGQGERVSLVSSDAMPALFGRRCVGTVQSGRFCKRQTRWYRRICKFCPCSPIGGTRTFLFFPRKEHVYEKSGQTMVKVTMASPWGSWLGGTPRLMRGGTEQSAVAPKQTASILGA